MSFDKGQSSFNPDNPIFNNNVTIIEDSILFNSRNAFIVFISISNQLLLVYSNDSKEIIFYDLAEFQMLKKYETSHKEIITFLKHFKDIKNKRDIIVSISYTDCNTKIWKFKKSLLSCIFDLGNIYNNGFIKGDALFHINQQYFN